VPALTDALKSENENVRDAAAKALERIDPTAAKKAGGL
jgi:HEAT repeat protein